jgi:hypothetical protein
MITKLKNAAPNRRNTSIMGSSRESKRKIIIRNSHANRLSSVKNSFAIGNEDRYIQSPLISSFYSKNKRSTARPSRRNLKNRTIGKRITSTSIDCTKTNLKDHAGRFKYLSREPSKSDKVSLSLTTKIVNQSKENPNLSSNELKTSWSNPRGLSLKSENGYNSRPLLVQDYSFIRAHPSYPIASNNFRIPKDQKNFIYVRSNILSNFTEIPPRFKSPGNIMTVKSSIDTDLSMFTVQQNTITNNKLGKLCFHKIYIKTAIIIFLKIYVRIILLTIIM